LSLRQAITQKTVIQYVRNACRTASATARYHTIRTTVWYLTTSWTPVQSREAGS
jgi:hypothetical protein